MIPFKNSKAKNSFAFALSLIAMMFLACEPPAKKRNPTDIKLISNNETLSVSLSHFDTLVIQAMQESKDIEGSVYRINELEKNKKQKLALIANQKKKFEFKTGPVPAF